MHQFRQILSWEQKTSRSDIVARGYQQMVAPEIITDTFWCQNGRQRRGLDKILTLENEEEIKIEEKFRRKAYPDIALETWSNLEDQVPGWCVKEIMADIVAYWIVPQQKFYVFQSTHLRRVLRENRSQWESSAEARINGFRYADARNEGYTTRSICVPLNVLENLLSIQLIEIH